MADGGRAAVRWVMGGGDRVACQRGMPLTVPEWRTCGMGSWSSQALHAQQNSGVTCEGRVKEGNACRTTGSYGQGYLARGLMGNGYTWFEARGGEGEKGGDSVT